MKWDSVHFTRVDADIADNLIDAQEGGDSVLSKDEEAKLKELFGLQVPDLHIKVEVKGLSQETPPVVATRPEFMRRMKDMAAVSGGAEWYGSMPDEIAMTVNANHPVFQKVLGETDQEKQGKMVRNLADLALLSQGLLSGASLTDFVKRSVDLMNGGPAKGKIIL